MQRNPVNVRNDQRRKEQEQYERRNQQGSPQEPRVLPLEPAGLPSQDHERQERAKGVHGGGHQHQEAAKRDLGGHARTFVRSSQRKLKDVSPAASASRHSSGSARYGNSKPTDFAYAQGAAP